MITATWVSATTFTFTPLGLPDIESIEMDIMPEGGFPSLHARGTHCTGLSLLVLIETSFTQQASTGNEPQNIVKHLRTNAVAQDHQGYKCSVDLLCLRIFYPGGWKHKVFGPGGGWQETIYITYFTWTLATRARIQLTAIASMQCTTNETTSSDSARVTAQSRVRGAVGPPISENTPLLCISCYLRLSLLWSQSLLGFIRWYCMGFCGMDWNNLTFSSMEHIPSVSALGTLSMLSVSLNPPSHAQGTTVSRPLYSG